MLPVVLVVLAWSLLPTQIPLPIYKALVHGAELDGLSGAMKTTNRLINILSEMGINSAKNTIYSDNEAMINFVKGTAVAKGIRHLELRLWYFREEVSRGKVDVFFMPGKDMPADQLTKILTRADFEQFRERVLGLKLLQDTPLT
jgi:hypothetical protein